MISDIPTTSLASAVPGAVLQATKPKRVTTDQSEASKLAQTAAGDSKPLLIIRSVFPFDLFPTVVTVDRTKITITYNLFFFSSQTQSILIKDIQTVIVESSILLSTIEIVSRLVQQHHFVVPSLTHTDANKLRELVEGLMVADKKGIDVGKVSREELKPQLETIGKIGVDEK